MNYYRNKGQMDLSDRLAIETGIHNKESLKKIAKLIGRHPSTVAHEIKENRTYIHNTHYLGKDCANARRTNVVHHVCGDLECESICCKCKVFDCQMFCEKYIFQACHEFEKHHMFATTVLKRSYVLKISMYAAQETFDNDIQKEQCDVAFPNARWKSLNPYNQDDITLLMNHINSIKRPGFGNKSPYELVEEGDNDFHELMKLLKMHLIPPDEVHLMPDLFFEK